MDQETTSLDDTSQPPTRPQSLQTLTSSGPLSSSLSTLSISSNGIPTNKDFHFYYNFDEFKHPIQELESHSHSFLDSIGVSATNLCKQNLRFPTNPDDPDAAYDWLVNVNDEIFERFGSSIDEFERIREGRVDEGVEEDGFQVVGGKKKKKMVGSSGNGSAEDFGVKVADRKGIVGGKAKIPFHISTIRKPQEEYGILVNNSNQRFEHVWLERSEDGSRFVHPLENLSVLDFVDSSRDAESVLPLPLEETPFKLIEDVKDLKELAAKLHAANEFAVDLEHNQYRSFQGLTCLMQISTRTEDFIVDTLKLRIHVGPYLREVFKDPLKKKVMHGADRDIIWLQRDFGIYVCNLFDTGQASRVLKLERYSLEHLLQHFCGVAANKEYQNADWRLRPLPPEMIKYAREDTHYLLHIYDTMTVLLHTMPKEAEDSDSPLVEVYKRSYDVCMQLYERELLTETSYLHIYGLQDAGFNAQQLAIVAGLYEWRDVVARAEDEGTGYILPNKTLLEIAKQMPVTPNMLRRVLKTKLPYVERNLGSIVSIIRHCMQNAGAFEAAAQQLKEGRVGMALPENGENDGDEVVAADILSNVETHSGSIGEISGAKLNNHSTSSVQFEKKHLGDGSALSDFNQIGQQSHFGENGRVKIEADSSEVRRESLSVPLQTRYVNTHSHTSPVSKKASVASVQVQVQAQKKPTGAFGALLGSKVAKRRPDIDAKEKEESKLEKIRSSVSLPFYSFSTENNASKPVIEEHNQVVEVSHSKECGDFPGMSSNLEEYIMIEENPEEETENDADSELKAAQGGSKLLVPDSSSEMNYEDGSSVSLSDLSSSFEKCFQSNNQTSKAQKGETQIKDIKLSDYATAKQQVKFGEDAEEKSGSVVDKNHRSRLNSGSSKQGSILEQSEKDNAAGEFKQGKRRHAFPASGNRSATFR